MPLDAGRPPPNADRPPQPPKPPDRSQTGPKPGDQPRPTDKPSSTSQAGQSSKPQSNFDKYLANPRQDSDQPGKGDGGTKAGKDGQAGDAGGNKAGSMGTDKAGPIAGDAGNSPTHDGGKGQPEGAAPTGEALGAKPTEASQGDGAKPQGDNSSRAGGKPEGQSGGGAKPEGQSGDGGKQQGSSGGDSKGTPERAYPGSKNAPDHEPYTVRGNPEKMFVENANARKNWNQAAAEVLERRYKKGGFQANLKAFEDHLNRLPEGAQKIAKRWNLASKQGMARYIDRKSVV